MDGEDVRAGHRASRCAALVGRTTERLARRRVGLVVGGGPSGDVSIASGGDDGHGEVPDSGTLFEIGSITKTFTALLLADGVIRRDWRLDTPVRELLPAGVEVPRRAGVEITLQHLATHTSGLRRSPVRLGLRENVAYQRTGADPYARLTEEDVLRSLGDARLKRVPGHGTPAYSNLGFGLLGTAMTTATGQDYGTLVRDRVCGPLGLGDTVVDAQMTTDQRQRMAVGFRSRRPADPWPLAGLAGAGALRSTASDMVRFLAAQVDPGSTGLGDAIRLTHATQPGGPERMGLGWHRAGDRTLWHNGGTGGFRSTALMSPASGTVVLALVNQNRGADLSAFRLMRRLDG
ncbi:beta-lactamase family protein [Dietzia sp. SLG310A2-38A2]|uniref:serine hydrolase domain-containing protein n=1 Tax=Dietzia sp. SLG310A2-38A2 TaxID=1630643 RepID=UPI0015F7942D|nr:serine hydrolase domain-containing protein [Dietzia sp. SLG310A2-38A2]MBB1031635.1 beta-lactamase family protein [Dietzia sp. SLG310A2-38A2]